MLPLLSTLNAITRPALQALLASLRSSGVQPTLAMQQGSDTSCLWQATLRTASLALHAVAEAGAQPGMGESVLGPGLAVTQVACIEGSSPCSDGGLGLDMRWRQQAAGTPRSMDELWAAAANDPGAFLLEWGVCCCSLHANCVVLL